MRSKRKEVGHYFTLAQNALVSTRQGGVVPREKLEVRITQFREHRMRDERSFVIGQGQEAERFRRSQEGCSAMVQVGELSLQDRHWKELEWLQLKH